MLVETRYTHSKVVISSDVFHRSLLEFKHTHSCGILGGVSGKLCPVIQGEIKAVGLEKHVSIKTYTVFFFLVLCLAVVGLCVCIVNVGV